MAKQNSEGGYYANFTQIGWISACVVIALSRVSYGANLLSNGSFETPVITGTLQNFSNGQSIGAWTTITQTQILNNSYTENGGTLHFDAEDGNQSIDLTGPSNQGAGGVQQTVTLTPGQTYALTFFVGNQDDSQPNYSLASTLDLQINSVDEGAFSNSNSTSNDVNWKLFTFDFTPTVASNTIGFSNATPVGDNYDGLDNVSLDLAPEPSSVGLLTITSLAALPRRRRL